MRMRWTATSAVLAIALTTAAPRCGAQATTGSAVYELRDDHVHLTGYDAEPTSAPAPIHTFKPTDFATGRVYRDQLLLERDRAVLKPFAIPDTATTLTITARSRPAGDVFPRLKIMLVTPDKNRHRVYEGYWDTAAMETWPFALSRWTKNTTCTLEVEMLNPGLVEEYRTWYLHGAALY